MLKLLKTNLVKATIVYVVSSFFNAGVSFLLLPFLTSYLSTEQYGILSMINATISIVTPFAGMSIFSGIQRKIADDNIESSKEYVFNSIIIAIVSSFVTGIIISICSKKISKITGVPSKYLMLIVIISLCDTIINTGLVILQFKEKPLKYAICRNSETIVNVILSIYMVSKLGLMLNGRVYGVFVSKLIFSIICFFVIVKEIGISLKFRKKYIRDELYNFGIPMIPTLLKSTILTYLDRLFITNMNSLSETGVYSVGNQLALPILFLVQAFNMAYVPWLYKKLKEESFLEKVKIVKLTYLYDLTVFIVSILWSLLASLCAIYILGNEYKEAVKFIVWLSIGYAFSGMHMMVVNYIYYMKQIKLYNIVTIIVIFSNVLLNYILIKINGSIGAAQATLIVNILSFLLTWIMASRIYDMPWLGESRMGE